MLDSTMHELGIGESIVWQCALPEKQSCHDVFARSEFEEVLAWTPRITDGDWPATYQYTITDNLPHCLFAYVLVNARGFFSFVLVNSLGCACVGVLPVRKL